MATQYLTREQLVALYGPGFVSIAETDTGANVDAVIAAANAEADAYVSQQVDLPPSPGAIEQVQGAVARIAACALYGQASGEALLREASSARKFLQAVAAGSVRLQRPADDPATPEDESFSSGADCGAAPRRWGW